MVFEEQILEKQESARDLLSNLAFFNSRNNTELIKKTEIELHTISSDIDALRTKIDVRDSPAGKIDAVKADINSLEKSLKRQLDIKDRVTADFNRNKNRGFGKNKLRFQNIANTVYLPQIRKADANILNINESLIAKRAELTKLENEQDAIAAEIITESQLKQSTPTIDNPQKTDSSNSILILLGLIGIGLL